MFYRFLNWLFSKYLAKKACILICYDGGPGLRKALKKVWRTTKLQRCIVHAVWQVHRYTTRRPKTLAGIMLRDLASDLYRVKTQEDAQIWIQRLFNWRVTFKELLKYIDL